LENYEKQKTCDLLDCPLWLYVRQSETRAMVIRTPPSLIWSYPKIVTAIGNKLHRWILRKCRHHLPSRGAEPLQPLMPPLISFSAAPITIGDIALKRC